jgi:hypothetical protein
MSKRSLGSKAAMKAGKERYRKEREAHKAKLSRKRETADNNE